MKFFTPDIWAGWQSSRVSVRAAADRKWERNLAAYWKQCKRIAPTLGKGAEFFLKHNLHDAHLLSLTVHDYPLINLRRRFRFENRTWVKVAALSSRNVIYLLTYEQVERFTTTTRNDLFGLPSSRFGDWGYDELVKVPPDGFKHDILFQTGTEVSICFKRFRFTTLKYSKKRIERIVVG